MSTKRGLPVAALSLVFACGPALAENLSPLRVSIVNTSTVVSDDDVAAWTRAIQRQVSEHVAPVWKTDAAIVFGDPSAGAWICTIQDGPLDNATELATHFVTSDGTPGCVVNARKILAQQGSISRNLSHELLEMIVNPWLSLVTFVPTSASESLLIYAREICDPVTAYSYVIDGVQVSDFTYPPFWVFGAAPGKTQMDYLGLARIALEPTAHSYLLMHQITQFGGIESIGTWDYVWGSFGIFGPG
jgi:hypothetical protein